MRRPVTLVLSGSDVRRAVSLRAAIDEVERAMRGSALGCLRIASVAHLELSGGAVHVKSAALLAQPARVAVKVNLNFPDNPSRNLPTIQGAIVLSDGETGSTLAILDSASVTALRTAAASAVAARALARPESKVLTVIGCGVQGPVHVLALCQVLPIETAYLFDQDPARAKAAVRALVEDSGLNAIAIDELRRGTLASDLVVTCTTSRRAFLGPDDVRAGSFIAAVGADHPAKQEISPELLARSRVVADVLAQCAEIGDLHHAIAAGRMQASDTVGELSDILAGKLRFTPAPSDIVVYDSTGTASQDVAVASLAYQRACDLNLGVAVEL